MTAAAKTAGRTGGMASTALLVLLPGSADMSGSQQAGRGRGGLGSSQEGENGTL